MTRGRKPSKKAERSSTNGFRPKRYANGYGNVSLLSQPEKRRKPYIIRVPEGYKETRDKNGHRKYIYKYKIIGYASTWAEGNEILVKYNDMISNKETTVKLSPVLNQMKKIAPTFEEIYEKAIGRKLIEASEDTVKSYEYGFKLCKKLHNTPITDIKTINLQLIIDSLKNEGMSTSTLRIVRKVMNVVMDYAVQNDIIDKQYASYLDLGKAITKIKKVPFSEEEIKLLFENDEIESVDTVLILLFTGLRINEFLKIKTENVHLEERYLITGSKTVAGKDRIIPINHKIIKYVKNMYNKNNEYLYSPPGYKLPIHKSSYRVAMFDKVMFRFGMKHTPHECRHTCASMLDAAGANKVAVQKILGHKGDDITEHVYTHKTIAQLLEAIDKI